MSKHLVILFGVAAFISLYSQNVFSQGIHQCKSKDGSIIYQQTPCVEQNDVTITNWNKYSGEPKSYTGQRISVGFTNKSLHQVLNIIARVSGNELWVNGADDININIRMTNEPWDKILHHLDTKYGLTTTFRGGKMTVQQKQTDGVPQASPPAQTSDDVIYDKLVATYEKRFPEIDPNSPKYNQSVIDKIKGVMSNYRKEHPDATASDALSYAVLNIMQN